MNIGTVRTFRIKELSSENPIRIYHNVHTKTHKPIYDMHYGLELGIVLKGAIKRFYDDYQIDVSKGDIWLCGMWEPHGFEIISAKCEVIVLVIWPTMLSTMRFEEQPEINFLEPFLVSPRHRPVIRDKNRKHILDIAKRIMNTHLSDKLQYKKLRIRLLATELLLMLYSDWTYKEKNIISSSKVFSKIAPAIELANNSNQYVSVYKAAKLCRMSRNHFCGMFKAMMGISFSDFALRHRLSRAAYDLIRTDKPIKTIAYEWGFTDSSHFNHRFKAHYNCSPLEYRNNYFKSL